MIVPTVAWVAIGVAFLATVAVADVCSARGHRRGVIACVAVLLVISTIAFVLYVVSIESDAPRATDWEAFHERVAELED